MTSSLPSTNVLTQFVQRAPRLYTLPAVAMKVIELTGRPTVDVRKLKECIEYDPALTAKILRVANSSLFGLSREITDLSQALALLDVKPLKLLVLGFSLPAESSPASGDLRSDGCARSADLRTARNRESTLEADVLKRYWRHTLAKAVAARLIAESLWKTPGDEAFVAGLLQPIGMLALIQDLGESYLGFLDHVLAEGGDLHALETEALGFDHAILSARLLDHWGLPRALVEAVGMPHDAQHLLALPPEEAALPQILHLAELCAVVVTNDRLGALRELLEAGERYRRMSPDQIEALIGTLEAKVRELADVLSLQLDGDLNYASIVAEAHARLSEAVEEIVVQEVDETDEALAGETEALGGIAQQASQQKEATIAARSKPPRAATAARAGAADEGRGPSSSAGQCNPAATSIEAVATAAACGESTDPGLAGRVAVSIANCRPARCSLTLVLVQLDDFDELIMTRGLEGAEQADRLLEAAADTLREGDGCCLPLGDGCFAVVMEDCDRSHAMELTRRMVHGIRESQRRAEHLPQVTVSAGLATLGRPPKNFPAQELIEAAQRCLSAAQLSGGEMVKSIEW